MTAMAFVCSFSSGLAEMKGKDKADPMKVLAVIAVNPRVSIFEVTETAPIAKSMDYLVAKKFIRRVDLEMGYPWMKFELTQRGKSRLKQLQRKAKKGGA
jgi:hypothetical protein